MLCTIEDYEGFYTITIKRLEKRKYSVVELLVLASTSTVEAVEDILVKIVT